MSPNDRFQVCGQISGLICTSATKTGAMLSGEKAAFGDDCPIEVFDCMAHIGKPELWRYDDDNGNWKVVRVRT